VHRWKIAAAPASGSTRSAPWLPASRAQDDGNGDRSRDSQEAVDSRGSTRSILEARCGRAGRTCGRSESDDARTDHSRLEPPGGPFSIMRTHGSRVRPAGRRNASASGVASSGCSVGPARIIGLRAAGHSDERVHARAHSGAHERSCRTLSHPRSSQRPGSMCSSLPDAIPTR